jgi:hypothetical protein
MFGAAGNVQTGSHEETQPPPNRWFSGSTQFQSDSIKKSAPLDQLQVIGLIRTAEYTVSASIAITSSLDPSESGPMEPLGQEVGGARAELAGIILGVLLAMIIAAIVLFLLLRPRKAAFHKPESDPMSDNIPNMEEDPEDAE